MSTVLNHPTLRFYRGVGPTELHYPAGSMIVIGGPVGVGKSTLISRLAPSSGARVISVDELRGDVQEQRGLRRDAYSVQAWEEAVVLFQEQMHDALHAGESVIVDVTAVMPWPRANLAALAHEHERPGHLLMLDGGLQLCLSGQAERHSPIEPDTVLDYVRHWERLKSDLLRGDLECVAGWTSVAVMDRPAANTLQRLHLQ